MLYLQPRKCLCGVMPIQKLGLIYISRQVNFWAAEKYDEAQEIAKGMSIYPLTQNKIHLRRNVIKPRK